MWFRRKDRMVAAARRAVPSRRAEATTVAVTGALAALTAASSGVSAMRQKEG